GRLPPLRRLAAGLRALALVHASPADDAERVQRVAPLRDRGGGPGSSHRKNIAELRAVCRAARTTGRALGSSARRAEGAADAQGPFPARQPPALQPQVLSELGAAVRRLRAPACPATRRNRRSGRRGVPPVQRPPPA